MNYTARLELLRDKLELVERLTTEGPQNAERIAKLIDEIETDAINLRFDVMELK